MKMADLDTDFCFPCSSCQAKFGSLRELRKHLCELSKEITKSTIKIPIQTEVINEEPMMNNFFMPQQPE